MITGVVNARHEATIRLAVHHVNGQEQEVEAILDTGFSGSLTLPLAVITALGLPWRTRGTVILANGSEDQFDIYAAVIGWDGVPRNILVEAADTDSLVGMALLTGYDVHIQVAEGGNVIIEALPRGAQERRVVERVEEAASQLRCARHEHRYDRSA